MPIPASTRLAADRSETEHLVQELASAVLENLNVEAKTQAQAAEVQKGGNIVMQEYKLQLNDLNQRVVDAMDRCVHTQTSFREENMRLLGALQSLMVTLAPYSCAAMGLWGDMPSPSDVMWPFVAAAPEAFTITLRKADGVSLGLTISTDNGANEKTILIEEILPNGAMAAWNRQCSAEGCSSGLSGPARAVVKGDRIVSINGVSDDVPAMLKEVNSCRLLKMTISRGGASSGCPPQASSPLPQQHAGAIARSMRVAAPEFVA